MKSVIHSAPLRWTTLLFALLFLAVAPVENTAAQGIKMKSGGGIFKKRQTPVKPIQPTASLTDGSADNSAEERVIIATSRKDVALRAFILRILPADRHYRENLADAIVFAYQQTKYKNIWNYRAMPPQFGRRLAAQLARHGIPQTMALDPAAISMNNRRAPVNSRDLGFTIAIADAAALVRLGAVPTDAVWPDWNTGDRPGTNRTDPRVIAMDLLKIRSFGSFDMEVAVDSMAPKNWIYRELQNAFVSAKSATENASRMPSIPDPATAGLARPGEPYSHAPALAEVLAIRGFLDLPEKQRRTLTTVTPTLAEAIKGFQRANGLSADGVMGSGTWKHLSSNPKISLRSRAINLHRSRLLPDDFGERYVIINLPSAELYAFENNTHVMSMRIVHGKSSNEEFHTPVFRDVMREVVFAPYWNVPESISVKEIYPKLVEDPTYLERNRYEIVDRFTDNATVFELNEETLPKIETAELWLRQKPTGANALGKVKFLLPNQFNVYLHDTPSKQYFAMADRAQSHGCIRLASPPKLAEWTLEKQGWPIEKVIQSLNSDVQVRQSLDSPVNVYVTYFTAFPRPTGSSKGGIVLSQGRDVYKWDEKNARVLAAVIPQ